MNAKRYIIATVCVLCAAAVSLLCFSIFSAGNSSADALSESEKTFLAAKSYIYKDASTVILKLPYTTINLTQTALTKFFAGDSDGALIYLSERNDKYLDTCYDMMDKVCSNYKKLLDKYNVSSSSADYSDYKSLSSMMSTLKSSSKELIKRATSFIKGGKSASDGLYTSYSEQLSDLSSKITSYGSKVDEAYEAIMKSLLGSTYNYVSQ